MCYHYGLKADKVALEKRYKASLLFPEEVLHSASYANAFAHPPMPIICHDAPYSIILAEWGLLPTWAKDKSLQKNTVNARLETIQEKPSFRNAVHNRCLVPFSYFYEWKWLDAKGKTKEKYELTMPDHAIYSFAGLYNDWTDRDTGLVIRTFTILTMDANEYMASIHNTKKRMPLILDTNAESIYLTEGTVILANDLIKGQITE